MRDLKETEIKVGSWFYLKLDDKKKERVLYVGLKEGDYLVTTAPSFINASLPKDVTAYFFTEKGIYEFYTNVLEFIKYPIGLLVLSYPKFVELKDQRNYKRIKCFVSARVQYRLENGSTLLKGIIKDISKKGCKIVFPSKEVNHIPFEKEERIIISVKFPGIGEEQKTVGSIKNILRDKEEISLGIEFDDIAWWVPPY